MNRPYLKPMLSLFAKKTSRQRFIWSLLRTAPPRGFFVVGTLLVTSLTTQAASDTWTGLAASGTSTDWNVVGNWNPSVTVPGAAYVSGTGAGNTDTATFGTQTTGSHTITDSVTNRMIGSITFSGVGATGSYTVGSSSNTLYLNTGVTIGATGANTSTLASNVNLGGATASISSTAAAGSNLTVSGNVSNNSGAASVLSIATSFTGDVLTLSGIIQDGTAKLTVNRGSGNGTILLSGANTFTGGFLSGQSGTNSTEVTQIGVNSVGSVGAITSGAFGTGTLALNGGTISSDGTTARTILNTIDIRSFTNIFGDTVNNGTLTFAGALTTSAGLNSTLQANSTVNFTNTTTTTGTTQAFTVTGAGTGSIAAPLGTNFSTITKTGTGTWTFAGAGGANTGAELVSDGTLKVGANNAFGIAAGNTLTVNELTASSTATFDLNGFNQQVASLNIGGVGAATSGAGQVINSSGTASTLTVGNIGYFATNNPLGGLISVNNLNLGSGTRTINVADSTNAAVDLTISSNIQGSAGFSKSGVGILLLTGASSNTGAAKVNDGTLQVGVNNALLTSSTVIVNEGVAGNTATFDLNGFNQQLGTIQIGDTASATTTSSNRVINSSATSSTLTVNAVNYTATGNPLGGLISVNTLDLNGTAASAFVIGHSTSSVGGDLVISSIITNGGIAKTGLGSLVLNGANTYAGGTALSVGSVIVGGSTTSGATITNGPLGTGTLAATNGSALNDNGTAITLANSVTLAGTVTLGSTGSGSLTFDGTGLTVPATFVLTNNSGLTVNNTTTIKDVVSGSFGLTKGGTGTLVLSGANTYTGPTTINGGILSINSLKSVSGGASALGAPTTVPNGTIAMGTTTTTGTLVYTGTATTTDRVISLTGTTGGATLDQSGTGLLKLTSNVANAGTAATDQRKTVTLQGSTAGTGEVSGVISDAVLGTAGQKITSLTKSGSGTWVLSGANTFSGATSVLGGNLQLMSAVTGTTSATGTGTVAASGGLTTTLSGTGGAKGAVTITNGSRVAPGVNTTGANNNFGVAGTLALGTTGGLTLSDVHLDFDLGTLAASPKDLLTTGSLTLGTLAFTFNGLGSTLDTSSAYTLLDATSITGFNIANITTTYLGGINGLYTATYSVNGSNDLVVNFNAAVVPEPGTWALMLGGLVMLVVIQRRRQRD